MAENHSAPSDDFAMSGDSAVSNESREKKANKRSSTTGDSTRSTATMLSSVPYDETPLGRASQKRWFMGAFVLSGFTVAAVIGWLVWNTSLPDSARKPAQAVKVMDQSASSVTATEASSHSEASASSEASAPAAGAPSTTAIASASDAVDPLLPPGTKLGSTQLGGNRGTTQTYRVAPNDPAPDQSSRGDNAIVEASPPRDNHRPPAWGSSDPDVAGITSEKPADPATPSETTEPETPTEPVTPGTGGDSTVPPSPSGQDKTPNTDGSPHTESTGGSAASANSGGSANSGAPANSGAARAASDGSGGSQPGANAATAEQQQ